MGQAGTRAWPVPTVVRAVVMAKAVVAKVPELVMV